MGCDGVVLVLGCVISQGTGGGGEKPLLLFWPFLPSFVWVWVCFVLGGFLVLAFVGIILHSQDWESVRVVLEAWKAGIGGKGMRVGGLGVGSVGVMLVWLCDM